MILDAPVIKRARFPSLAIEVFGKTFDIFIMGEFKNEQRVVCPDAYVVTVLAHSFTHCVLEFNLKPDAAVNKYASVIVSQSDQRVTLIAASVYEYDYMRIILTPDAADILAKCLVPWHTNLELMSAAEMKKLFLDKHGEFVPTEVETPKD